MNQDSLLPVGVKNRTISGFIFLSGENAAYNIYLICNLYQFYHISHVPVFPYNILSFIYISRLWLLWNVTNHVIIVLC